MSQGSGLVLLFHSMGEHDGALRVVGLPQGRQRRLHPGAGPRGPVVRRGDPASTRPSSNVITKDGRVTGVALEDGTELYADTVVSALDPRRTFLELVEPRELPTDLVENINRMRFQGTSAKVNFALDGAAAVPRAGRPLGPVPRLHQHRSVDGVPRAGLRRREVRLVQLQALHRRLDPVDRRPDMAPPGKHVMSCFVQYAPYHLKLGGTSDWDTERDRFGDTVQAVLESLFPGFGDLVLQREVVTPLDIERVVGLTEGNIFAGEFLAPQMYFFRPAPGWNQYRTPIDGYYQCGSGTHPGGCVMGAPGKLASQQILSDRKS